MQTDGQTQRTGKLVHEIKHDGRCRYDQTINQDNDSLDEMSYSLRTHMEQSDSLTYEHCKDKVKESRDIKKYINKHNQMLDETNIQREICFAKLVLAYN